MKTIPLPVIIAIVLLSCSGDTNQEVAQDRAADSMNTRSFPSDKHFVITNDTFPAKGPSVITRDVLQDKNGIYWFATYEGLMNYDGKQFTNVTLKEGLSHHRVFCLLEDSKGILWFGTLGAGVYRYDPDAPVGTGGKEFRNISSHDGLISDTLECIFEDAHGTIWFGTPSGVSSLHDSLGFTNTIGNQQGLTGCVHTISQDNSGLMWIGTDDGLFQCVDGMVAPYYLQQGHRFSNVRSLFYDDHGTLWIGGGNGLYKCFYNESDTLEHIQVLTYFTSYICDDNKGNLLMSCGNMSVTSTGGGMNLYRYNEKLLDVVAVKISPNDNQVFGSIEDRDGNIWFGTMQGICRYDGTSVKCFNE